MKSQEALKESKTGKIVYRNCPNYAAGEYAEINSSGVLQWYSKDTAPRSVVSHALIVKDLWLPYEEPKVCKVCPKIEDIQGWGKRTMEFKLLDSLIYLLKKDDEHKGCEYDRG